MKILALETSAKSVSAAVVENGAVLASAYQNIGLTHSVTLMPLIDSMLKNAGLTARDMGLIAVAAGPGSFTGLRIGVSPPRDWPGRWSFPAAACPHWRPWRRTPAALRARSSAPWMPAASRSITRCLTAMTAH